MTLDYGRIALLEYECEMPSTVPVEKHYATCPCDACREAVNQAFPLVVAPEFVQVQNDQGEWYIAPKKANPNTRRH